MTKSIEQHKIDGTYKKTRHGKAPVAKTTKKMTPPTDMSTAAKKTWRKLAALLTDMSILSDGDFMSLRLLCDSYAYYIEACDVVAKGGGYIQQVNKSGGEYWVEHPALKARSRYWKEVESMCKQFGLTPSSRTGIQKIDTGEKEVSALAQMLSGRRN